MEGSEGRFLLEAYYGGTLFARIGRGRQRGSVSARAIIMLNLTFFYLVFSTIEAGATRAPSKYFLGAGATVSC
jgi:hypothetical protein